MHFIGRHIEKNLLEKQQIQFVENETPLFAVALGEGGIGKTALLTHFLSDVDDIAIMPIDWRSESVELALLGDGTLDPDAIFNAFRNAAGEGGWGRQFGLYNKVRKEILQTRELVEDALNQSGAEIEVPKSDLDIALLASIASELLALAARVAVPQMGWAAELVVLGLGRVGIEVTLKNAQGLLATLQAFMRDNFTQTEFDYFIHPDQQLAAAVGRGLLKISEKQKLIVVMDAYEEILEADEWVHHIIEVAGPNVGWLFGSRVDLETMGISQRFPHAHMMALSPFTEIEANALVKANRGYLYSADELADLMEKTGGNPAEILAELKIELSDFSEEEEMEEFDDLSVPIEPEIFDPEEVIAPIAQAMIEQPLDFAISNMPDYVSLGDRFMKAGARDEAYASYQRALTENPNSARAWSGLGNVFRAQNKGGEAERCYRIALDCDGGNLQRDTAEILLARTYTLSRSGQYDSAIESLEELLSFATDQAEPLLLLAQAFMHKRDYASAEQFYKKAESLFVSDQFPYHELGAVQTTLGRLQDALTTLQKGIRHQPKSPENFLGLGRVHMLDNRLRKAESAFETAHFLAERDRPEMIASVSASFGELYSRLDLLHAAERYYSEAVGTVTEFAPALAGLGRVCRKNKDTANATKYLVRALESDPHHSQTYYEQGRLLEKSGDLETALTAYAHARQTAPADSRTHERYGILAHKAGLLDHAKEGYIAAIHANSQNPAVYQSYADILFDRGEFDRAANNYEVALDLGGTPDFAKLGYAHAQTEAYGRAEWACEQKIATSDPSADDWVALGDYATKSNNLTRAETAYEHALALSAENPHAHLGLAQLLKPKQAVFHLKAALKYNPDNVDAIHALADNLAKTGDYNASIIAYSDVVERDPQNIDAWLSLAHVSETNGAPLADLKTLYQACLIHNPMCGDAHARLGRFHLAINDLEAAEEAYGKAMGCADIQAEWHIGLADARFAQGAYESALDSYREATFLETDNVSGYIGSGHCLYALDQLEAAQVVYQDALQLGASDPTMDANLADSYMRCGLAAKAEPIYRRFVNFDGGDDVDTSVRHLRNLGSACHVLHKARDGITAYEKAIRLNDECALTRCHLGDLYYQVGDDANALASYQRASELDPMLVEPWLASAAIHQSNGNPDHAEAIYETAVQHHPDNPHVLRSFATAALANGDQQLSLRFYKEAKEAGDDSAELHTGFGDISFAKTHYPLAESHYVNALQRDPDYAPAILGKALCRLADGDLKATRTGLARCEELADHSAQYHRAQGLIAFTDKEYPSAISHYESAQRLDATVLTQNDLLNLGTCYQFTDQPVLAQELYHAILQTAPDNTLAQIGYGLSLHWLKRDDEAIKWLERAKADAPDDKNLWIALGNIYFSKTKWRESVEAYSTALKYVEEGTQDSAELRTLIGDAHRHLEDTPSAIRFYRAAVSDAPTPAATLTLAQLYLTQNRFKDAKALLETDVFDDPPSRDLLRTQLNLYTRIHDYDQAKAVLRKILHHDPQSISAMLAQADIALQQNEFALAERSYKRILSLDSNNVHARSGLGITYLYTNRQIQADNLFNGVLLDDPHHVRAHRGQALLALGHGETDAALSRLKTITERYPDDSQAWVNLGYCAGSINDLFVAVNAYQKAIELNSYNEAAYSSLAECFLHLNDYESAKAIYGQALDIYENDLPSQIGLAVAQRHLGEQEACDSLLEEVRPRLSAEPVYNQACFESVAGNEDKAIELLKLALAQGQLTAQDLLNEPELHFIHETSGFQKLLRQIR